MNVKRLLFRTWCLLAVGLVLAACSDDDEGWDDSGSKIELPQVRAFFLNEGTFEHNNAGIMFYAPNKDASTVSDLFLFQNGMSLGDTGQSMIEYKDRIYVAVYGSNYLVRLNAACVEEARVSFVNDEDLKAGIRYIDAEDGYIYASFYGGVVAKINANTLKVEAKLKNLGYNLEGVAIEGNQLYVADSYKVDENGRYVYQNDVIVIDLRTFQVKEKLEVVQNPNDLVEEDDKVFLLSWDYSDESYVLQMIDPDQNNKVTRLGYATKMAAGNDMLYLADSRTDYSNWPETTTVNTFACYNIKTGQMRTDFSLKNAPEELGSTSIYMMAVDEETGDLYIGTTYYSTSNGNIYRFRKDGTYVEKFDCGGQNPKAAVFFD